MTLTRRVCETLRDGGEGTTFEIAAELDADTHSIAAILSRLNRRGCVVVARKAPTGTTLAFMYQFVHMPGPMGRPRTRQPLHTVKRPNGRPRKATA